MLISTYLRSSNMEATFWSFILKGTVGTVEKTDGPLSLCRLPITGLCRGATNLDLTWFPSPSSGLLSPPPKLQTLRHVGGDRCQVQLLGCLESGPGLVPSVLYRPWAEAASFSPSESCKDSVLPGRASSSLCPWRPYYAQKEEGQWAKWMNESSKWDSWRLSYFST